MILSVVTGAAGFIGSHLVDVLLSRGHRVIGIDNLSAGRLSNLKAAFKSELFSFLEADLNDFEKCKALLADKQAQKFPSTVWHMAANSNVQTGMLTPQVDLQNTFMTTFHVLQWMRDFNMPALAFASTSAIYGEHRHLLTESTGPLCPISYYGAMKLGCEGMISAALQTHLKIAWIFRFPNVVGSRSTHGVLHDLIKKLLHNQDCLEVLGDGTQKKPYLHVSELTNAMLKIVDRAKDPWNCYNIGSAGSTTTLVRHIAETVVRKIAPTAHIKYMGGDRGWVGDVPQFNYSTEKLKTLGWEPRLTSDEAVELAINELTTKS